ncbi:hypothetical protein PPN31114_00308 [Pandoraea pneumonica]|uniref:Multidrug ABC transporter ATPase n=1 Tax=Pandoraea pneumonica TaxID=2508299 RepID=A0A5E4RNX4_9BURK|nr:hypothetical protein [Pandoraea pneumonica]VVD65120.1 hypothetical protein PPN31114_00308 [Pandoraea pneumonica]
MRTLLASALLCAPLLAHADCQDNFKAWAQTLQPGRTVDADVAACKVWPANPAQTLAILPLPQKGSTDDDKVYDVEVLVADSQTGKIIAHSFERSAITSDAVQLRSLSLDTAPWRLTPQVLAFGVRATYEGSSRVNPYSQTTLSLYVVDGAKLRKVVNNLSTQQGGGEWDGNCAGSFSDTSRAVSVGPEGKVGYAKLIVSEKTVTTTNKPSRNDCASKESTSKSANVTLEYDGAQYHVPKALSGS